MQGVWVSLAVGCGTFAAPSLGAATHSAARSSFNQVAALSFVPLILSIWLNTSDDAQNSPGIWPGLTGIAGMLLLLPLTLPNDAVDWAGLVVPAVGVAAACAGIRKRENAEAPAWPAALLLLGGLLGLSLTEALRVHFDVGAAAIRTFPGAVVFDTVLVLLTVLSLVRLRTYQYTARYFLVPAIAIAEGLVLLRPGLSMRTCIGVALLFGATYLLLRTYEEDAEPTSLHLP